MGKLCSTHLSFLDFRPEIFKFTILHNNRCGSFFLIKVELMELDDILMIEQFDHSIKIFHFFEIFIAHIFYLFDCIYFIINFTKRFINCWMSPLSDFFNKVIFLLKSLLNYFLCFRNERFRGAYRLNAF